MASVGGVRILDVLVGTFREALGSDPILIANDPDAPDWHPGLRVAPDIREGAGAFGGLHTAVVGGPAPVVCVAWDMPFVPAGLIAHLAAQLELGDAVLPASEARRGVEPLCAAYGPACRIPMEDAIDRDDLRAIAFHDAVKTCILPLEDVAGFGNPEVMFFNVNTKEDLKRADKLWRQRESFR